MKIYEFDPSLNTISIEFRTYEICKIYVTNYYFNLKYVPKKLITKELCEIAISQNGIVLKYVPIELRTEELCNLAVKTWRLSEEFAPPGTSVYNNYIMKKALL